jgi:hypothetical protein
MNNIPQDVIDEIEATIFDEDLAMGDRLQRIHSRLQQLRSQRQAQGVDFATLGYVSVIEVEKALCKKLGVKWTPSGISIETLIDRLAAAPTPPESKPTRYCNKCGYFGPTVYHKKPDTDIDCNYQSVVIESKPSGEAVAPVAWSYEYHDFGDVWTRWVILNRPDGGANPPTKHHGSLIRNVQALYLAPPSLSAAVKLAYEECAKIVKNAPNCESDPYSGFNSYDHIAEEILAAIPQNATEALDNYVREKCLEVAKAVKLNGLGSIDERDLLPIVNSVLEGGE